MQYQLSSCFEDFPKRMCPVGGLDEGRFNLARMPITSMFRVCFSYLTSRGGTLHYLNNSFHC